MWMPEKEASVYFIFEKAQNKGNSIHFTASPGERAPPLPGPFWVTGLDGGGGGVQWLSVAPGAQSQSQLWCGMWSRTRIYNQSWMAHKTSGYECEVQRGKAFCPSVPLIRLRPRPEGLLPVCPLLFQLWQEACQHAPCKLSISPTVNEEARRGTLSFKLLFQTQRLSAGHLPSSSRESPSLSISYSVEKKF